MADTTPSPGHKGFHTHGLQGGLHGGICNAKTDQRWPWCQDDTYARQVSDKGDCLHFSRSVSG
jgi:hypothetical protein